MIQLSSVTKYFHKNSINEVLALKNINLNIQRGDFITVIGSNGAGKSTLLNCLAGAFPLETGTITIDGKDITRWQEHRRAGFVGRVFQDPLMGTCASLSIEQNLALAKKRGKPRGLSIGVKVKDREYYKAQLKTIGLGLEDRLQDKAGLLSGGQRQALTMLMAIMVRPELLLLDEHTAALDPKTANQILIMTRDIIEQQQITTLMVTHNMNHAIKLGNRLIMMHRGEIILDIPESEKQHITVNDLLDRFYKLKDEAIVSDRILLQ